LPNEIRGRIWAAWGLYREDSNVLSVLRDAQQAAVEFWIHNPQ